MNPHQLAEAAHDALVHAHRAAATAAARPLPPAEPDPDEQAAHALLDTQIAQALSLGVIAAVLAGGEPEPDPHTHLGRAADDPATCARLVELACTAVRRDVGELPPSLTDDSQDPALASPAFRHLARTDNDAALRRLAHADGGSDDDAVYDECTRMDPAELRAAADTALGLLTRTTRPGRAAR